MHAHTWSAGPFVPAFRSDELIEAVRWVRAPAHVVQEGPGGRIGIARDGSVLPDGSGAYPHLGTLPPLYPEWLGDRSFAETHGTRFPYIAGAMANGIATTTMVVAMARAGMLGFFGAAGLSVDRIDRSLDEIEEQLHGTGLPWGSNLIHAPNEPSVEMGTVELYLRRGVRRVSASAYMGLNPMIVRYAFSGVRRGRDGRIERSNYVFAKISRPEVARRFLSPPPTEMLNKLVERGWLTPEEADLAAVLPVAEDIIVEADSGGHTDNRALPALFPTIARLRDRISAQRGYSRPIRVGAAGGLGTPSAVAGAFALGAAFVLTGSVNQGAVESGLSREGRQLLATAGLADVVMAPAADMFELGVKVQVLQRGTLFGARAQKLYDTYRAHHDISAIPLELRQQLEREIFQMPLSEVVARTEAFWRERDEGEHARMTADTRHAMALAFRWYLGLSSRWAIAGEAGRRMDYQIWCGPAMGAFNAWAEGSFLEDPEQRTVVQIARNLLEGAAVVTRAQQLRSWGVPVPPAAFDYDPRILS